MEMVRSSSTLSEVWVPRSGVTVQAILATAVIVLSILSWTLLSGPERGFLYGVFIDPPNSGFAAHGPNYFQSVNIWYFMITAFFVGYCSFISWERIDGLILRMVALVISTYPLINMLLFKYDVIVNSGVANNYKWLQNSVYTDIFSLIMIVVLIALEMKRFLRSEERSQLFLRDA
jgi:hypothetical protein